MDGGATFTNNETLFTYYDPMLEWESIMVPVHSHGASSVGVAQALPQIPVSR